MAFNINAQVILSGPKNIKAVTNTIKQQLGNINVNVGVNVPKNASQQVKSLQTQMNALNTTTKRLNAQSATTGKQMKNVAQNTKQAANAMQVLGKETALTFKRFAAAGIVTATFFRLTNAISEAVPKALEFERELVKIQQTTGGTINQLNGLRKTADELAKSLGLDANEIISVGRVFAQTGQTLDQVEASLRAVARASLAPSFGEMSNTAEGLIAALAQFNIQASQSEAVLASINAVSKQFAVESQDIIGAIRRTGGVFAIAATDAEKPVDALNQLIAIFTSVRSTTRESAETIATGLRTIFSRIQRPQTIEFLKSLNINLTDAEGNFVGLFSAFRILSTELDGIIARGDTLALSRIVEELGGIRQVGKLIPAIREFRKAEAAFAVAAEGASQGLGQDVATGLTPLIKTFEQVQARFDSLIRSITESATFEVFASTIAGLANAFLGLAEALVPVLPAITTLATLKIAGGISDFAKGFLGSGKAGGGIAGAGAALGGAVTGGAGAAQAAASNAAATATAANTQALAANTTAVTSISGVIGTVNTTATQLSQTATALNASINRLIPVIQAASARSALGGGLGGLGGRRGGARPPRGFNRGGFVPGSGNSDTVPAMLTPGEFVIKKSAVQAFGAGNLNKINKYNNGTKGTGVRSREPRKAVITMSDDLAAVFLNSGKSTFDYDKTLKKGFAFENAVKNVPGLEDFRPNVDTIETQFTAKNSSHLLDESANTQFKDALQKGVSGTIKDIAKGLVREFEVPEILATDAAEASARALDSVDFDSLSGHIFEGVTAAATGATLTDSQDIFDFTGINKKIIERINKLFTPDVKEGISILEAKNTATSDATTKISDTGSIFNKILRSAGATNPLGVIAKFASGGMASGTDTVPALLTPGEFVVNKSSAQAFGYGNLNKINKYADGGIVSPVQMFQNGTNGRGVRSAGGTDVDIGGLKESFGQLAGQAVILSVILPQLVASFASLDGSIGGLIALLTNLAFIGPSLLPVFKTIGTSLGPIKGFIANIKEGARIQRITRSPAFTRTQASTLGGRLGGAGVRGGFRGVGNQIGKEFVNSSQKLGARIGSTFGESAAKAGRGFGRVAAKGLVKSAGGFALLASSLLVEPIGNAISDAILGSKIEIAPGVFGREGVSAGAAGAAGGITGGISGALTGAGLASVLAPITGGFSLLLPVLGSAVGAISGFVNEANRQAEFLAFESLAQATDKATKAMDRFAESGKTSEDIRQVLAATANQFSEFDVVLGTTRKRVEDEASAETVKGGLIGGTIGAAVGGVTGFVLGGPGGAKVGAEAGAGIGAGLGAALSTATDVEKELKTIQIALSKLSDEALAKQVATQQAIRDRILETGVAVENSAQSFNKLREAGLRFDGEEFTGSTQEYLAALEEVGDLTGQGKAALASYKNAVRATALQIVKSGEGSEDFTRAVAKLGDRIATASPEDLAAEIGALEDITDESKDAVIEKIKTLQLEGQANDRTAASAILAAEAMNKLNKQIEALGEGLNKLQNISAGGVARFEAFTANFQSAFDQAFSSDAVIVPTVRFDPFENIDAASTDEIAQGLERIRNAIGDTPGGAAEGATAGFESILASVNELPFAVKAGLDELRAGGTSQFTSPEDLISKVFGQLEARGAAPTGAAAELLKSNLREIFTSRQGEGGTVALQEDLILGVVNKINEGGEAIRTAVSNVTKSLDTFEAAVIQAANVEIQILKKRQEASLKRLDIQKRTDEALGVDRGRDPRAVAQENLVNRLFAIQTNVQAAADQGLLRGVGQNVGLTAGATTREGLQSNLKLLQQGIGELEDAVASGTASDEQIKQLALLKQALSETKQSLDALADDTTRLAAIQDRLAQIESRKQTAQEQVLDFNRRRAEAVRSGNFEELGRLNEEKRRPLDALAKIRAGEGLTDVEAADLEAGLGLLEGGGFIGPDEARKIRNALTAGIVDSDFFRNVFAGFTIGPNALPVEDFVGRPESFGGGAFVGEVTPEEATLRADAQAIADEQKAIVTERQAAAEKEIEETRKRFFTEVATARASFEAAGEALKKLRGEAARLPAAVGQPPAAVGQPPAARPAAGAGAAIGPQGGAPVADVNGGGLALIATTIPNNTTEMALLRTEIQLLKDQISQGLNVNLNGNQNINIANLATAGNEFQQITELTTARAFAEKTPELEQQFGQTMTSQLNTA